MAHIKMNAGFRKYIPVIFLLSMGGSSPLLAQMHADTSVTAPQQHARSIPSHAPGQVIVKFKSEGPHAVKEDVEGIIRDKRKFSDATDDRSDTLDVLKNRYRVEKAEAVFKKKGKPRPKLLKNIHDASLEDIGKIKQKFPKRTARAGKNAKVPALDHVYLLEVGKDVDILKACEEFKADPHVEYCQPNYKVQYFAVPNDPYYHTSGSWGQAEDDLWGLKTIHAEQAWDMTRGEGTISAVVDTGVDYNHPDIWDNMWVNPEVVSDVNQDGDITLDDVDSNGNRRLDQEEIIEDLFGPGMGLKTPMDFEGHGTHCAGTIAAVGDNNLGLIGVAPQTKLMAFAMNFDSFSSGASGITNATDWGADVINNSWGCVGGCYHNPLVEDAIRYAHSMGTVVAFAAMNDGADFLMNSPQNMTSDQPIVVGASNPADEPTYFSSFGVTADVYAPGGGFGNWTDERGRRNILSLKAEQHARPEELGVDEHYMRLGGTSMAAPHVVGVAALMLSRNPDLTVDEVRQIIRASGNVMPWSHYGQKRLNAYQALQMDSALTVIIDSPNRNSRYPFDTGSITITGTAKGDQFRHYQIFYKPDTTGFPDASVPWMPVHDPVETSIESGSLALWDTSSVPRGFYILRLVAVRADGQEFETMVRVSLQTEDQVSSWIGQTPDISQELVVWNNATSEGFYDRAVGNISIYDRLLEKEVVTSSGFAKGIYPQVSADVIVWYSPFFNGIYACRYDRETEACDPVLIDESNEFTSYAVTGSNIFWIRKTDSQTGSIYSCELNGGICPSAQILSNIDLSHGHSSLSVSGHYMVYEENSGGNPGIKLCELNAAKDSCLRVVPITADAGAQFDARVAGNTIAWLENDRMRFDFNNLAYGKDVYYCALNTVGMTCAPRHVYSSPDSITHLAVSERRVAWDDFQIKTHAGWYPIISLYDIGSGAIEQLFPSDGNLGTTLQAAFDGDWMVWAENSVIKLRELSGPPAFKRGDANDDGVADISDALFTLGYLFLGYEQPVCLDAADVNDSGTVDLSDPIYLLQFLFSGGNPPPEPFSQPGQDLTEDDLSCGE